MDLPSLRELELETLLRERDSQVAELTDEVNQLRKFLTIQPAPSRSDPLHLPPALVALLQSFIPTQTSQNAQGSASTTMTAALLQRTRILQEENDELYSLLRVSETGQLKEEVRSLKKTISRLDGALKDSHGVVSSLSEELDKSYTVFLNHQQQKLNNLDRRESRSPPPRARSLSVRAESPVASHNGDIKPLPTGPRAHKKPRLAEPRASPARSPANLLLSLSNSNATPLGIPPSRAPRRDRSPLVNDGRRSPFKEARMDVDEDVKKGRDRSRDRPRERDRDREKDRPREREPERERPRDHRDRDREREGSRHREQVKDKDNRDRAHDRDRTRRNGRGQSGGGGNTSIRKGGRGNVGQDDRTLRERMGL